MINNHKKDLKSAVKYYSRTEQARVMFGDAVCENLLALSKELAQVSQVSSLNSLELFIQIEVEFSGKSELIWTKAVAVMDVEPEATPLTALEYVIKMMRLG